MRNSVKVVGKLYLLLYFIISTNLLHSQEAGVVDLYNIGFRYYSEKEYDSALVYFNEALRVLDEGNNGYNVVSGHLRTHIANSYCCKAQYQLAIEYGRKALEIYGDLLGANCVEYGQALRNLSWYYEEAKQYQEAISYCLLAADCFFSVSGETSPSYISSVGKIAHLYLHDDLLLSKKYYNKLLILEGKTRGRNTPEYALALNNLGYAYSQEGCYDSAALCYKNSKRIRKEVLGTDHKTYKDTQHNLIIVYNKLGNKEFDQGDAVSALNAYLGAKEIIDESCDSINYLGCVMDISKCYWVLGDYNKAIEYGMDGALFASKFYGENSVEHARALVPLVYYFTVIKNYDWADEVGLLAETIYKENDVENYTLNHYLSLLKQAKNGNAEDGIENLLLSLNDYVAKYGEEGQGYAAFLNNIANSYYLMGDYENAIKYGRKCLEARSAQIGESHPDYAITLFNLAEMYYLAGYCEEALSLFKSFNYIELSRVQSYFTTMIKEERSYYWALNNSCIKRILDLYECYENDESLSSNIFNSLLFSKGILLYFDMAVRDVIYKHSDSTIISHYELYNQVRSSFSLNKKDKYTKYEYKRVFDICNESERMIMHEISSDLGCYIDSIRVSYLDVYKSLSAHSVAIEFCKSSSQCKYYAIVARKSLNHPVIISLNNEGLGDSLLLTQQQTFNRLCIGYEDIWSYIDPYIEDGDTVYFAMDGILHQTNIENIVDSMGIMACDKYNLRRVSSTRQICHKHNNIKYASIALFGGLDYDMKPAEKTALYEKCAIVSSRGLFNDSTVRDGWKYLPGTNDEIQAIQRRCLNKQVKALVFTGNKGTEEAFKSLSGQHIPIIHIATHGFFFNDEKANKKDYFQAFDWSNKDLLDNSLQRSGLIMSGGQNAWMGIDIPDDVEDGILLAEEIASMDLSGTDLVVLSACETGLGDITSDGVFGLQRAFKMAGVQTLVMSLWKVDDNATSLMMQTFYEQLLSGKTKREAFNLAQAAVRAKYPEPYYWAGFIMLD